MTTLSYLYDDIYNDDGDGSYQEYWRAVCNDDDRRQHCRHIEQP